MLQGWGVSCSEDENLGFETLSPLQQPDTLPQGLTLHASTSPSVGKPWAFFSLSQSSRLGGQGFTFHQAQKKHWPCWWMVNRGYLWWVNRAESFNTLTVLKSQALPFIRRQGSRDKAVFWPDTSEHCLWPSSSQIWVTHHYYSRFFHMAIHIHHTPQGTE